MIDTPALIEQIARALVPALSGSQEDAVGRDLPDQQFDDLTPEWQAGHLYYASVALDASGLIPTLTRLEYLEAQKAKLVDHLSGLIRYADAVRHQAGMSRNQAERLEAARQALSEHKAGTKNPPEQPE